MPKYSVLLLYPEEITDGKPETYFDHVVATDSETAISLAQIHASKGKGLSPADFAPLLVLHGHHDSLI